MLRPRRCMIHLGHDSHTNLTNILLVAYSGVLRARHGGILIRSPFREQGPDLPSQLPRETGTAYPSASIFIGSPLVVGVSMIT
jgi:hypothetical protein